MSDLRPTFCGKDCGGNACPLAARMEGGQVAGMARNPAAPEYLRPCAKGYRLHDEHFSPARLTEPLIADGPRGTGRYRPAGWDEALSLVAESLGGIRGRLGPTSTLALGSAGSTGALHDSQALLARFLDSAGGSTSLTGNYSSGAAGFAIRYLFGAAAKRSGWDPATLRHSRLVVLWGANVVEARLGAELGGALSAAAEAGVPMIAIDPRRSATAKALGARWIPIRPGTDAAMMLAVLHTLLDAGLVDFGRASALSTGLDSLAAYVGGAEDGITRSAAWAEPICGVPAKVIEEFALEYGRADPAALLCGYSIQRTLDGEETFRLSVALQVATGNFGVPGGSSGSLNNRLPTPRVGTISEASAYPSAVKALHPVLRWPDAILEGRVSAAFVCGFNAVNQGGDALKSVRAMRALEFSVASELFMTPTARLCDVILPAASPLEKEDIGIPWLGNYLLFKKAILPARGGSRSDWDIFSELADRMGFGPEFSGGKTARRWLDEFVDGSEIADKDAFRETGVYIGEGRERIGLSEFAADPTGRPLPTPSGKIELRSQAYAADTGRGAIPRWVDKPREPGLPFLLVTPKHPRRVHSQGGGPGGFAGARSEGAALTMHRGDAARVGLNDGDEALVSNGRGAVRVAVRLSDDIMPGVVSLEEGAWLELGPDGVDTAGSANALTATEGSGPSNSAVMHGLAVDVVKAP